MLLWEAHPVRNAYNLLGLQKFCESYVVRGFTSLLLRDALLEDFTINLINEAFPLRSLQIGAKVRKHTSCFDLECGIGFPCRSLLCLLEDTLIFLLAW